MATQTQAKQKLHDIIFFVNLAEIARRYFNRSSSWLYHKFDGIDGNGGTDDFSPAELEQLRGGLYDLADRIRKAADTL